MNDAASASARDAGGEFSIGFLTAPGSDELIACEEVLRTAKWQTEPANPKLTRAGISRWSKTIEGRKIYAHSMAVGRKGQTASAIETFGFLERCKPSLVFLTGIAGSLWADRVLKGDVVVSKNVRWWTQDRIYGDEGCDQYRPLNHLLTQSSISSNQSRRVQKMLADEFPSRDRSVDDFEEWNVHFGEIYTWDYVVDSSRIVSKLNTEFPDCLCVEMEAGGFLGALERVSALRGRRPMRGYVVRGISGYAAKKDNQGHVRVASSRRAAIVAVALAERMCSAEELRDLKQAMN